MSSLARIGLLPSSSSENRQLAVDLAELIVKWEEQRVAGRRSFIRVRLPSVAKSASDVDVCSCHNRLFFKEI